MHSQLPSPRHSHGSGKEHLHLTGLCASQFPIPFPLNGIWSPFFLPTPTLSGTLPASDYMTSCLIPQRFLSTGCEKQSRYDLETGPSFPSHPVGWALSPPSAPGSQGFSSNGKPSASCPQQLQAPAHSTGNSRTQAAARPRCPHRLSLPGLPSCHPARACPGPSYLAGSSGGQAGCHVSLWDSSASMSLSRSVCTSAPATVNDDGVGGGG